MSWCLYPTRWSCRVGQDRQTVAMVELRSGTSCCVGGIKVCTDRRIESSLLFAPYLDSPCCPWSHSDLAGGSDIPSCRGLSASERECHLCRYPFQYPLGARNELPSHIPEPKPASLAGAVAEAVSSTLACETSKPAGAWNNEIHTVVCPHAHGADQRRVTVLPNPAHRDEWHSTSRETKVSGTGRSGNLQGGSAGHPSATAKIVDTMGTSVGFKDPSSFPAGSADAGSADPSPAGAAPVPLSPIGRDLPTDGRNSYTFVLEGGGGEEKREGSHSLGSDGTAPQTGSDVV